MPEPVSQGHFLIEIDGVTAIVATKATPPGVKNNLGKYQPGNQPMPTHYPATSEIEEMTFTHARGVNQAGRVLVGWLLDVSTGFSSEKKNLRFITMNPDRKGVRETWELRGCLPTMYKPSGGDGSSTDPATFDFSLQADEARLV